MKAEHIRERFAASTTLKEARRASHDWCPRCGVSEAFHPEACSITPGEWTAQWDRIIRILFAPKPKKTTRKK